MPSYREWRIDITRRNAREHRLRQRIDDLNDRIERLTEQLEEARKRRKYYSNECNRLRRKALYWRSRALPAHEEHLAKQREQEQKRKLKEQTFSHTSSRLSSPTMELEQTTHLETKETPCPSR